MTVCEDERRLRRFRACLSIFIPSECVCVCVSVHARAFAGGVSTAWRVYPIRLRGIKKGIAIFRFREVLSATSASLTAKTTHTKKTEGFAW